MRKSLLLIVLALSCFALNAQNSFDKKVLATIGKQKVTVGSFLNIYAKNDFGGSDTVSIKHAVNLFINFRLKVIAAENRRMDTITSFKQELAGYRNELIKPYFEDKKVEEKLLKQAYQRSRYDVRVSHILIKLSPYASPADTLKAWNKIEKIRQKILHGMTFRQAALEYSDDPSARNQKAIPGLRPAKKGNGGDLGYFTVFNMVYPFESAAYNTPIGHISQPVRTRYGYHLIKVTDKRPAMGVARVEHIFIPLKPGASAADSAREARQIWAIYERIKHGLSFEKAAKLYSQDKGSSYLGGKLPQFTSGQIVPQFVINADTLKPGQISKPFQTIYGFHIVKLLDRKKPGNFKQEEPYLKRRLAADQRYDLVKMAVISKLRKEDHLKIYPKAKQQVIDSLVEMIKINKLSSDALESMENPLLKIGRKHSRTFDQNAFVSYVRKHKSELVSQEDLNIELGKIFKQFADDKLVAYEKQHLGLHHPGFKSMLQEYHDGILLFNLTNKMVWEKATEDTAGLKRYYLWHKNKYQWKPRVKAIILKTSARQADKLESALKEYNSIDSLKFAIAQGTLSGFTHVTVDSGYYEQGDNNITDQIKWVKGISEPVFEKGNNRADIVLIEKVLPAEPMSFYDAKGLVIADYQDLLQKLWVNKLRKKYPVHINQRVLKKLEKKYPVKKKHG